jgi:ABC-2 type transport system ATP-binding protein
MANPAAMISASNLTRRFGDFTAVDGVSFEVAAAEVFAFLGPNGAGKTTTIKMLTTLLSPTSGSVAVDGLDPARQQSDVRRRIGIVFQDPSLDQELTAWENMDLHGALYGVPRRVRHERSQALLQTFGLWDRKDGFVKTFSGGMRRRLEIARGLLHTPKILFLDEPTLGLDPQSRNQLWTHVKELNQREGVTVFLTTHYMDEAERVASRIAIMDHGKIVAIGSSQELKQRTGKESLEEAFLALTGTALRDETVGAADRMRQAARMWTRR